MIPWVRNLGRPQLGDSFAPRVPTGITHWYSAGGCAGLDCTRWFPSQVGCLGGDGWKAGISWVLLTPAWCSQGNWSSHVAFQKPLKECSKRTKWSYRLLLTQFQIACRITLLSPCTAYKWIKGPAKSQGERLHNSVIQVGMVYWRTFFGG